MILVNLSITAAGALFALQDAGADAARRLKLDEAQYSDALWRMIISLAILLLLILAAAKWAPRWFLRFANKSSSKQIHIVDTVRVDNKTSLILVKVGARHYLLGSSGTHVEFLAEPHLPDISAEDSNTTITTKE